MGVYRVIGGRRVRGVDPGGEFAADLTEGEETALVDAGHVAIVTDDVATTLPDRKRKSAQPKTGAAREPDEQADEPAEETAAEAGATADETGTTAPDPHGEE